MTNPHWVTGPMTMSGARGGLYPDETLWLYGDRDPFYPLAHSRDNFAAFQAAGGQGAFRGLPNGR